MQNKPRLIHTIEGIIKVTCFNLSLAVTSEGELYFWGKAYTGDIISTPMKLTSIPNKLTKEIHVNRTMAACID
jgi:alpha-tubulin suppressor-like RCC1 family protein